MEGPSGSGRNTNGFPSANGFPSVWRGPDETCLQPRDSEGFKGCIPPSHYSPPSTKHQSGLRARIRPYDPFLASCYTDSKIPSACPASEVLSHLALTSPSSSSSPFSPDPLPFPTSFQCLKNTTFFSSPQDLCICYSSAQNNFPSEIPSYPSNLCLP